MNLDEFYTAHNQLSIVKLGEPILIAADVTASNDEKRISMASSAADGPEIPTPASLEADLKHYQELFTKLRFSYVEQVTKEKFLRAVVGDPPIFHDQNENTAFEAHLLEVKASLKAQKLEVSDTIKQLESKGRDLSQRYKVIELQLEQLQNLPAEIESLQETLELLRSKQAPKSADPSLSLPLPATLSLLAEKQNEMNDLDRQLKLLEAEYSNKTNALAQAESSLKPLQLQKQKAIAEAKEAMKRKESAANGLGDELEEKGRWLNGVAVTMDRLLDVKG